MYANSNAVTLMKTSASVNMKYCGIRPVTLTVLYSCNSRTDPVLEIMNRAPSFTILLVLSDQNWSLFGYFSVRLLRSFLVFLGFPS